MKIIKLMVRILIILLISPVFIIAAVLLGPPIGLALVGAWAIDAEYEGLGIAFLTILLMIPWFAFLIGLAQILEKAL